MLLRKSMKSHLSCSTYHRLFLVLPFWFKNEPFFHNLIISMSAAEAAAQGWAATHYGLPRPPPPTFHMVEAPNFIKDPQCSLLSMFEVIPLALYFCK